MFFLDCSFGGLFDRDWGIIYRVRIFFCTFGKGVTKNKSEKKSFLHMSKIWTLAKVGRCEGGHLSEGLVWFFFVSVLLNEEKKNPHSQPQNCFPMSSKEFRQRERESKQCPQYSIIKKRKHKALQPKNILPGAYIQREERWERKWKLKKKNPDPPPFDVRTTSGH